MKMKLVLIICIFFILVGISIFAFNSYIKGNVTDGPGMENNYDFISLNYSYGGGELGDYHTIKINDKKILFTKCEGHGSKEIKMEANLDDSTKIKIINFLNEGNTRSWTDLEKVDYTALDEPSTNFSVIFIDGTEIKIKNDDIRPDGWSKINEIIVLLDDYIMNEGVDVYEKD